MPLILSWTSRFSWLWVDGRCVRGIGWMFRMRRTKLLNPPFRGIGFLVDLAIGRGGQRYGLYRLPGRGGPLVVRGVGVDD
jgi:hypothetical protein